MCALIGCMLAASFSLMPRGVNGIFVDGETPELLLSVSNVTSDVRTMRLDCRTSDYFGREVRKTAFSFGVTNGCVIGQIPFEDLPRNGYFVTSVRWRAGEEAGEAEASFVKLSASPAAPDSLFGMSSFGGGTVEMCARLGVGTRAVGFPRELGARRNAVAKAREYARRGIRVVGHLNVLGERPYPEREATVAELVGEVKDVVHEWAAVGEVDLQISLAEGNRQRYIDQVRTFSRAIRRADPTATFVALGCSGTDGQHKPDRYPVLRSLLPEVCDVIDGLGIDQYTPGQTYGEGYVTLDSEQTELREMMLEAKRIADGAGLKLVTIDEKGPCIVRSTPLSAHCGARMADIVARDFVILKTLPFVRHWLYFRPFNWDPKTAIDWGMWENGNPRQTVSAYGSTARLVGGSEYVKSLPLHKAVPCHLFRKDGRAFAVLWYDGREPLKIEFLTGACFEARDVEGNVFSLQGGVLELSGSPVYLFAGSREVLESVIGGMRYAVPDEKAVLERENARKTVEAYRVRRVSGWEGMAEAEEIILEEPYKYAPGYADLKSHQLYNGATDLSVRARFGHDGERFLMEYRVKDDRHLNRNRPPRAFDGDCVQFAFDGDDDWMNRKLKGEIGFGDDDSMFVTALAKDRPLTFCHVASAVNRSRLENRELEELPEIVRDEAGGMTYYRVSISFGELAPLKAEKGRAFGFSFCVFDRDPGENGLYRIEMTRGVAGAVDPSAYRKFIFD